MLGKEGVSTGSQVSAVGLQMFAQGKRTNLRKGTQCLTSYTLTIWFTFITGALSKELLTPIWVLKSKIGRGREGPSSKIRVRNWKNLYWVCQVSSEWGQKESAFCMAFAKCTRVWNTGQKLQGGRFQFCQEIACNCSFQLQGNGWLGEEVSFLPLWVLVDTW